MKSWKKTLHQGSVLLDSLETRVTRADGTPLIVLMNASLLADEILISYMDISKQKEAERGAREAYKVLLSVFSGIEEAIYVADPETYEVLYVNDRLVKHHESMVGKKCYTQFQNRDSPCPFCTNSIIFGKDEGSAYVWEFFNEYRGRWFRCIDKAIRWPDGRRVRFEMAIDMDEQKRMEEALAESLERYRVLSESASIGIWQLTREGKTVYANPAMRSLLGVTLEEDLNRYTFLSFFPSDQHESISKSGISEIN